MGGEVSLPTVYLDFETRSRCDLRRHGGRRYAADPSTELLCAIAAVDRGEFLEVYAWGRLDAGPPVGWAVGEEHLKALSFAPEDVRYAGWWAELPEEIRFLAESGATFVAHNAHGFDRHVWDHFDYPPAHWRDSMELTRRASLPSGLDEVGRTLFGIGKDGRGTRTLRMLMSPRKNGEFLEPDGPQMRMLLRYCVRDVLLMAAACEEEQLLVPHVDDPVLDVHRAIDERGVFVDVEFAKRLLALDSYLAKEWAAKAAAVFGCSNADAQRMLNSSVALPKKKA